MGLFYISDRLKEIIKVKGFLVSPAEVEAILLTHPEITDAAVIGVSHDQLGEVPKAFVVKKQELLSEKEIQEFVAGKVSKIIWLSGFC
jgi:acyl-CoA synthetase (AMP-forming)/AMP-acid ligase II